MTQPHAAPPRNPEPSTIPPASGLRRIAGVLVPVLVLFVGAGALGAQEPSGGASPRSGEQADARRGWIGIAFRNSERARDREARRENSVRISGVLRGSPADRAGIRPGEVLLSIDGEPMGPEELAEWARDIRAGDSLTLGLRGPDGRREVFLVAGPPPEAPPLPGARLMARMDSMEAAVRRRLDSIRTRMRDVGGDSSPWPLRTLPLLDDDGPPEQPALGPEPPDRGSPPGRPPRPYALGADYVAGARMVELNPTLAEYFDVDGGVLAIDVLDGSPAAEAGLVPGDVIVALGGREVRSVEELRRALLERGGEETLLRIIRKGEELGVPLP